MIPNPQPFNVFVVLLVGSVYVLFRFSNLVVVRACVNQGNF